MTKIPVQSARGAPFFSCGAMKTLLRMLQNELLFNLPGEFLDAMAVALDL